MVKIFIDEKTVEVEEGTTVLKAAEQAGIKIPHLCYHTAFIPEGNCRMCLVEIEGLPKLELACSTQVREGMKVFSKSEKVIEARKGVLEFLLADHPLDCPICDKAGDCKLQDYYEEYGLFESQFREIKEKRKKKVEIGKNLIHDQERCILCTRCVRFLKDVTKTRELGVFNRGVHSEISTYNGQPVDNNYSGNLAEICPVGAITDSDFRFKTRTWFLENGDSICPLCSRGCNIVIQYHKGFSRFPLPKRIYRIKARENAEINKFWICDLGRYGYSYMNENRLDRILTREDIILNRENAITSLAEELKTLIQMKKSAHIAVVLNTWLSNEELFLLKKIFLEDLGIEKVHFIDAPEGEPDDFLLTSERSPNRRGAQEIGFDLRPLDPKALAEKTDLLLLFGPSNSANSGLTELGSILDKIKTKVLFSSSSSDLDSQFDIVFPTALIAEKGGSLTNTEGKVQRFSPALEAPGESLPEWKLLVDLANKLGKNLSYYGKFTSPEAISAEMKKEIPFFEK